MSTWTEREKLTYLVAAMEASGFKPDFKVRSPTSPSSFSSPSLLPYNPTNDTQNTPLPPGRTIKACQHMISGLKKLLESDLAAMEPPAGAGAGTGS
jgi:hypothetical protein